jgi:hypothetical protein
MSSRISQRMRRRRNLLVIAVHLGRQITEDVTSSGTRAHAGGLEVTVLSADLVDMDDLYPLVTRRQGSQVRHVGCDDHDRTL